MKTKTSLIMMAAAACLIAFSATMRAGVWGPIPDIDFGDFKSVKPAQKATVTLITCQSCKMHGVKDVDLAQHQRALAKATGKRICPNCAGLVAATKFNKDGTIFQGNPDFVCSGCDRNRN